jgi:rhodanese-related sulfurtransferase
VDEAISKYRSGGVLFADARLAQDYTAGHIKGAVNLNIQELDAWVDVFFRHVPPDTSVITYCDGPHCTLATQLAHELIMMGYENTYHMKDGWLKWRQRSMPTETGPSDLDPDLGAAVKGALAP